MTWKRGLPPGKYYPGMEHEYEVYYSPGGIVWHRKKQPVSTKDTNHE